MVVLVTGAGGQLGQAIAFVAKNYPEVDFVFCNSKQLDITNKVVIENVFSQTKPDFCINAAAYTAVDKAESEPNQARLINVEGAKNLAEVCRDFDVFLIHISTDFVFSHSLEMTKNPHSLEMTKNPHSLEMTKNPFPIEMTKNSHSLEMTKNLHSLETYKGYKETDKTNPQSIYGQTKLEGELAVQSVWDKHIIIRTSWVYSQFGNNFMKTMLRLASERETLSVVNDQIGTPTNAVDLANAIIKIIVSENLQSKIVDLQSKIFNFSNEGQCSWYEFAKKIFEINKIKINLKPIPTTDFPTPAKRPQYSVLDKTKIKNTFGLEIQSWEESLEKVGL